MRILCTIPHFFQPHDKGKHASQGKNPQPRIQALTQSITNLRQLFGQSQTIIDIGHKLALPANQTKDSQLDIIICTTQDYHLLDQLSVPSHFYHHYPTQVEPLLLGFECQAVLRDYLGKYDYYCFLEDDLIIQDPWFFIKLNWFTQQTSNLNLLQPNRYEISSHAAVNKAYVDGDLLPRVTAPFQNVQEQPELKGKIMGIPITFCRALNPHSGCYFLNARQMNYWTKQEHFLERDSSFISPLESAATLGIMKTFKIYKTVPQQANFLEIQHFGTNFLSLIGKQVNLATSN
ncbi:MAG: calcium-binding protein [Methylacidiphilales bacterium]|nr:calcium-binding protein [Candidatus Methylacidiphilales bacterium]NJR15327.1 calcium-binding protein [Calothrix sp. CSU_2_0]